MQPMNAQSLRALLDYDPQTGVFRWRAGRLCAGRIAGSLDPDGYVFIRVARRNYQRRAYAAHRLAWLYVHGEWPPGQLDHRDCNPSNNAIANLRPASSAQQRANSRAIPGKKTPKGVTVHRKTGKFQAQIKVNGKNFYLGLHETKEAAHTAYLQAAQFHFGEFARAA